MYTHISSSSSINKTIIMYNNNYINYNSIMYILFSILLVLIMVVSKYNEGEW